MHMKSFKTFNEQVSTPRGVLAAWRNKDAADYGRALIAQFGPPNEFSSTLLRWFNIAQFDEVFIKDESVDHDFPAPHKDFVYSVKTFAVPENLVGAFAHVTGSILVDGLKQTVTARCGKLVKNAVTLGFVLDVAAQKADPTKEEYSRRILGDEIPQWYFDEIGEVKKK